MQMRFILGTVGLVASIMLPAQATPGSVYDLPSEITVTNIAVHAGAVMPDQSYSSDGIRPTLPSWIFDEEEIRANYWPTSAPGLLASARVHSFVGGGMYVEVGSAVPLHVSADASWSATLTNTSAQSRTIFGSFVLRDLAGCALCRSKATVTLTLGDDLYRLHGRSFIQTFHEAVLAPGESLQMSMSLDVDGGGDYNAFFNVFSGVYSIPEPSTLLLSGIGLAVLGVGQRRRLKSGTAAPQSNSELHR